ncbi:MAG TPA: PA2779 family protein [Nitrospirota bacterium]|nr:PA2779 family protein [Nitrospirota bacterium]
MKCMIPPVVKMQPRISLITALLAIFIIAGPAEAMFVPSAPDSQTPLSDRAADMAKIQKMLESKTLQQRLVDYGLSPEGALDKINGLSDEQVHMLATHIDALQAGGMRTSDVIIILLLIVLLLVLI